MSSFDTKKTIPESSANPIVDTYTIWNTANIVILSITNIIVSIRTWWSPTYNGIPMIQAWTTQVSPQWQNIELWYLLNPPTWIQTINIPNTWEHMLQIMISSYISSTWVFEFDTSNQISDSWIDPTVSVIPTTNTGFIVDILYTWFRSLIDANNRTLLYANDFGRRWNASQYYLNPPISSVAMSYTQNNADWAIIAGVFKEVTTWGITNIKLWSNTTNKMYIWSTEVLKAYLWSTIIYDKI